MVNSFKDIIMQAIDKHRFNSLVWVDSNHNGLPERDELTSKDPNLSEDVYEYFYAAKLKELTKSSPPHAANIQLHGNEYTYLMKDDANFSKIIKGSLANRYYDRIYVMVNYAQGINEHLVTLVATKGKNIAAVQAHSKDPEPALVKALEKLDLGNTLPPKEQIFNDKIIFIGEEAHMIASDPRLRVIAGSFGNLNDLDHLVVVINRISPPTGDLFPITFVKVQGKEPIQAFESKNSSSSIVESLVNAITEFSGIKL